MQSRLAGKAEPGSLLRQPMSAFIQAVPVYAATGVMIKAIETHFQLGNGQHDRQIAPQCNPKTGLRGPPLGWLGAEGAKPTAQSKAPKKTTARRLYVQLCGSLAWTPLTTSCVAQLIHACAMEAVKLQCKCRWQFCVIIRSCPWTPHLCLSLF